MIFHYKTETIKGMSLYRSRPQNLSGKRDLSEDQKTLQKLFVLVELWYYITKLKSTYKYR